MNIGSYVVWKSSLLKVEKRELLRYFLILFLGKFLLFYPISSEAALKITSVTGIPKTYKLWQPIDVTVCFQNDQARYEQKGVTVSFELNGRFFSKVVSYRPIKKGESACITVKGIDFTEKLRGGTNRVSVKVSSNLNSYYRSTKYYSFSVSAPDLKITSFTVNKTQVKQGEKISATVCAANVRPTAVPPNVKIRLSVIISKTNWLSRSSKEVGYTELSGLPGNKTTAPCPVINFYIPGDIKPGKYWLAAYIDKVNKIPEEEPSSFDNNKSSGVQISVSQGTDLPNLKAVNIYQIPPKLLAGQTISQIKVCAANTTKYPINTKFDGTLSTYIYLGGARITRVTLATVTFPGIKAYQMSCQQIQNVKIPEKVNIIYKTINLFFTVDSKNLIPEQDTSDNEIRIKVPVEKAYADLALDSVTGLPSSSTGGSSFSLDICVKNEGTLSASEFRVGIYHSTNKTISSYSDLLLSWFIVQGLGPGRVFCKKGLAVKLPSNAKKTDYLGIYVDDTNSVSESRATNNILVWPLNKGSSSFVDLELLDIKTGPIEKNKDFDIEVCFRNKGSTDINMPFKVKVYYQRGNIRFTLPWDLKYSPSLTEFSVSMVPAGQKRCLKGKVRLPQSFSSSTVWIAAFVDSGKDIAEDIEDNNYLKVLKELNLPDLTVGELIANSLQGKIGSPLSVRFCVANQGKKDVGNFQYKLEIYNKKNSIGFPVSSGTIQKLSVGQTFCKTISIKLSTSLFAGMWQFRLAVDPDGKIEELRENNNTRLTSYYIYLSGNTTLDLELTELSIPKYVSPNQKVNIHLCAKNNGPGQVSSFEVEIFYSKDKNLDANDKKIDTIVIPYIYFGDVYCVKKKSPTYIPKNINPPPNSNWLIAKISKSDKFSDTNQKNNIKTFEFFAKGDLPDLIVESITGLPTTTIVEKKPYSLTVCIKNRGKVSTKNRPIALALYVSSDSFIDTDSTRVSEYILIDKTIPSGGKECAKVEIKIPSSYSTYKWIGAIVDILKIVEESDEDNNVLKKKLPKVTKAPPTYDYPDLTIAGVTGFPSTITPGQSTSIKVCIKNNSPVKSPPFSIGLFQSENSIISIFDYLILEVEFPAGLGGNKTECKNISFKYERIPLKNSYYYMGVIIDFRDQINEENEYNNTYKKKFSVNYGNLPDLLLTKFTSSATALEVNKPVTIEFCVKNGGKGSVPFPFTGHVSLGDKVIYQYKFEKNYHLKTEVCHKATVTVPPAVKPGKNKLTASVDLIEDFIKETEERKNNQKSIDVTVQKYSDIDLVLSEFYIENFNLQFNSSIKSQICVTYNGKAPLLTPAKVEVFLSQRNYLWRWEQYRRVAEFDLPYLLPGDTVCPEITWKMPISGESYRYIIAFVNRKKYIVETDYKNNTKSIAYKDLFPQPDLVITGAKLFPPYLQHKLQPFDIEVCIKNIGLAPVTKPFSIELTEMGEVDWTQFSLFMREVKVTAAEAKTLKPSSPALCKKITGLKFIIPHTRKNTVRVEVNPKREVEEASYSNTKYIDVPLAEKYSPKLIITSVVIKTSSSLNGLPLQEPSKPFYAKVCVKNIGASIPFYRPQNIEIIAYQDSYSKMFTLTLKTIKSGEEKCLEKTLTYPDRKKLGKKNGVRSTLYFKVQNSKSPVFYFLVGEDYDKDGVVNILDCDDNDKNVHPAFKSIPAAPEICDGKDNDCDGKVDENTQNIGQTCSAGQGACKVVGLFKCDSSGKSVICNTSPLLAEKCDGRDNDCDGKIDNGADKFCPAGTFCISGSCKKRPCQFHFQCPSGLHCSNGYCAVLPKCKKNSDCPRGFQCSSGNCSAGRCSDNAQCGRNQVCDLHGLCSDACSSDAQCPSGSFCRDGRCFVKCQSDSQCTGGFRCLNGVCSPKCPAPCKKGEFCLRGQCVKFDCTGYGCPKGLTCRNFTCYDPEKPGLSEKTSEKAVEPSSEPAEPTADGGEFVPSDRAEPIADTGEVGAAEAVEAVGESAEFVSSDRGEAEGETVSVEGVADGGDSTPGEGVEERRREPGTNDRAGATDRAGTADRVVEERGRDKGAKGPERAGDKVASGEVGGGGDGSGEAEGCGCWGGGGSLPLSLLFFLIFAVSTAVGRKRKGRCGRRVSRPEHR